MKIMDIRKLSTTELSTESVKLRTEIYDLKHKLLLGQINNVKLIKIKRKDLARVLTVLSEQLLKETK